MRPVERGPHPLEDGQAIEFREYAHARPHLEQRLGSYCSYCGMRLDASLAVEHVKPKSLHHGLETTWDNLLLACINCNSTKGDEDITLDDYLWPDIDNPLTAIEYGPQPRVRDGLPDALREKARRTLALTGQDHEPDREQRRSNSDRRRQRRQEAWDKAMRSLRLVRTSDSPALREQVLETARCDGYWAVWYTVLSEDDDLRRRMVEDCLPGTCRVAFDAEHRPIARPAAG